ncbi:MAG TPA: hypothetical protein VJN88_01495 [Ktedonobacterales bacterium]|nr:hypothetical protein [Ktedonobacterales bacterium]
MPAVGADAGAGGAMECGPRADEERDGDVRASGKLALARHPLT